MSTTPDLSTFSKEVNYAAKVIQRLGEKTGMNNASWDLSTLLDFAEILEVEERKAAQLDELAKVIHDSVYSQTGDTYRWEEISYQGVYRKHAQAVMDAGWVKQ